MTPRLRSGQARYRLRRLLLSLLAIPILVCAGDAARQSAPHTAAQQGLTAAPLIVRAYDTILNADFAALPGALATACGPAPAEACDTLEAVGTSWRIALDPDDRSLDAELSQQIDYAIRATLAWTAREPDRAEAWLYRGAAYGARAQWRVLRGERLAAARDGKRIKESLERALSLDPGMHDAKFGIGMYQYYAAVAPAALRMLRWLLMLPGGDRAGGLQQMTAARDDGELVRGEADYQLHVVYLWYEERFDEALQLVESLRARYPRNPLFHQARAEILDVYFHDQMASLRAWEDLRLRAQAQLVGEPDLVITRAQIKTAQLLNRLDETDRAVELLEQVVLDAPARPHDATAIANAELPRLRRRLAHEPYRIALQGWRAFERGDLNAAESALTQSLAGDPSNATTQYRLAQVLLAQHDDDRALEALERVLAPAARSSPIVRANALFDAAHLMERRGDRARAITLYLEASHIFGADRLVTERAAQRAHAINGAVRR